MATSKALFLAGRIATQCVATSNLTPEISGDHPLRGRSSAGLSCWTAPTGYERC